MTGVSFPHSKQSQTSTGANRRTNLNPGASQGLGFSIRRLQARTSVSVQHANDNELAAFSQRKALRSRWPLRL